MTEAVEEIEGVQRFKELLIFKINFLLFKYILQYIGYFFVRNDDANRRIQENNNNGAQFINLATVRKELTAEPFRDIRERMLPGPYPQPNQSQG